MATICLLVLTAEQATSVYHSAHLNMIFTWQSIHSANIHCKNCCVRRLRWIWDSWLVFFLLNTTTWPVFFSVSSLFFSFNVLRNELSKGGWNSPFWPACLCTYLFICVCTCVWEYNECIEIYTWQSLFSLNVNMRNITPRCNFLVIKSATNGLKSKRINRLSMEKLIITQLCLFVCR